MTWKTPKTNWKSVDTVTDNDFNRIEGNIDYAMNLVEPGKTLIKQAIENSGITIASNTPTFQELAEGVKKIAPNAEYTDALSSQILNGKKAIVRNKLVTGSMADRGTQNKTLSKDSETYTISEGYHDGNGKVKTNISNLYAKNIKEGEVVGGVMGNYSQIKFKSGSATTVRDDSGNSSITIDFPFQPIVVVVFFPGTSDSQYIEVKYLDLNDSFTNRGYQVSAIINDDNSIKFRGGYDGETFDYKVIGVID